MRTAVPKSRPSGRPSTRRPRLLILDALLLLAFVLFAAVPHAAAQGCAMCYQNAASSGTAGTAALRHGIVILLLPALGFFLCVFFLIYRRNSL